MSLIGRLRALDARAGITLGQAPDESRTDYLRRIAQHRTAYVPQVVYEELVDLRREVDRLEARLARLEASTHGTGQDAT